MKRRIAWPALPIATMIFTASCAPAGQSAVSIAAQPSAQRASSVHRHSWTPLNEAPTNLLYVTNSNAEVTVYSFLKRKLLTVLTGFTQPMGECVDANQNVYIADFGAHQIVEYAHGGSQPIKTIDDSPDSPYACSVDPTTGNLAVANNDGASQQGNIAIWNGSGVRTTYTDSMLFNFEGCAYDNNGTLLVTNGYVQYPYHTYFAWLPKGGSRLVDITLFNKYGSSWGGVEGVQWDGKYFAIDEGYLVYRESLIHGQAYYVGYSAMSYSDEYNYGPYAFFIHTPGTQATQAVEGLTWQNGGSSVGYWNYPAGGSGIGQITHAIDKPFGVAISLRTQ
jgi:hypothetical protein